MYDPLDDLDHIERSNDYHEAVDAAFFRKYGMHPADYEGDLDDYDTAEFTADEIAEYEAMRYWTDIPEVEDPPAEIIEEWMREIDAELEAGDPDGYDPDDDDFDISYGDCDLF